MSTSFYLAAFVYRKGCRCDRKSNRIVSQRQAVNKQCYEANRREQTTQRIGLGFHRSSHFVVSLVSFAFTHAFATIASHLWRARGHHGQHGGTNDLHFLDTGGQNPELEPLDF